MLLHVAPYPVNDRSKCGRFSRAGRAGDEHDAAFGLGDAAHGFRLIEIEGDAFLIQGEPVRDRERLVWTVDLRPA